MAPPPPRSTFWGSPRAISTEPSCTSAGGLHRLGYRSDLPNLVLVGASAGYPSVPGVISNGMDVVELITGERIGPIDRQPEMAG